MTTMKEMTHKKVLIEKRTKPNFASAMAEITAVADAGFIAELTALEPENVAEYHFGINYQEAWEIGIYRWEEEGFKIFADGEEVDSPNAEDWMTDSDIDPFADKPQMYISKDIMDALKASTPKEFDSEEMTIEEPEEAAKSEGVVSRLTRKFWGKPKGEDNAQNAYAEALSNLNAEEAKQDDEKAEAEKEEVRPKPISVFEGSDNIEVYVECENCDAYNYQTCYKTNNYIKCMNCKEKMHIRPANESEKVDLDVDYMANRRYRTVKERYEYKQQKGLI